MALVDIPTREASLPATPRRAIASLFSLSKINSTVSSFSNHFSPLASPRTVSESMMDENIENAEAVITKWGIQGGSSTLLEFTPLFHEDRREAKEFIRCVRDLRKAMQFFVSQRSASARLVQAQNLMNMAMQRLETEFYQILSANRAYLDPESVSSRSSRLSRTLSSTSNDENESGSDNEIQRVEEDISEVERLSVLAMSDLRMIADCMISSGYSKECVNIYKLIRRSIVDEGLYRLGIERYSSSQISKMNPSALENQMNTWLKAIKIAVKTLLHGEKFLCDHVFSSSETIRESCFANIANEAAINLFRFPEFVAKSKRWPEKIFLLMDLHEALSDVLPDIESIFSHESLSSVKFQALSSIHKLGDSVQTILAEFESTIQKNSSRTTVPGGAIHPLTISVMDYLSALANYSGVLSVIIADSTSTPPLAFPESYFESPEANETPTSAVTVRLAWIILVLLCKLDSKAESYNDIALTYLFLSNNLQFVLEKVHTTALKFLLGDDWVAKLERKVKVYATNYEAMAWGNVFACLQENSQEEMSQDKLKAYFRQFNSAFEEAYRKQMLWVVPDGKLRDDIKISIARKLVPAYGEFYNRHIDALKKERDLEVLVRFSPDNLGNYLSDILHGNDVSDSSPSSSSRTTRYCLI